MTQPTSSDNVCPGSGMRAIGERIYAGWQTYAGCAICGQLYAITKAGKTPRHNKPKAK